MTSEAATAEADRPRIDELLSRAGCDRRGDPVRVAAGTLNRNYRVGTNDGPLFARCYRTDLDRARIEREHGVTRWVADRGIPAVAPIDLDGGISSIQVDGEWWALFPWVDGRPPVRGETRPVEAEAIGDVHGRVQAALAEHPESDGRRLAALSDELAWDTADALERLQQLARAANEAGAETETIEAIAFQRSLIEAGEARPFADLDWLPCQLLHGDFHDEQVLLNDHHEVVGAVDWELNRVAARVWELLRSLSFAQFLETPQLEDYLRGYARHVTLDEAELRGGLELWWQTRLHSTWVYEAHFLEGNERVAALFAETDRHLRRFAHPDWREAIAERLVAAARG